jgi:hypothetical protein
MTTPSAHPVAGEEIKKGGAATGEVAPAFHHAKGCWGQGAGPRPMIFPGQLGKQGCEPPVTGRQKRESRMLIILVVLYSGLWSTPAEPIILVSKLEQTWSAKPSVLQRKSTFEQALPDMWPDPYRGCPQQGAMYLPVVTSAAWVVLRAGDAAQQRQMGSQPAGLSQRIRTGVQEAPDGGWKTFVSPTLPVTVDYPPNWSVREETTGVTFTSARGATIQLMRIETGVLSAEDFWREHWLPHTRCSARTNAYGIAARVCYDTLASSYTADFVVKTSHKPAQLLSLSMPGHGDLAMFNTMLASVRPAR